jgi:membrane protease YdiL (CAAX protease family)
MVVVILLLIVILTFLLSIISKFLELLKKSQVKYLKVIKVNNVYIWFSIIIISGIIGFRFFNICLPKGDYNITLNDIIIFVIASIPFGIFSGYEPGRKFSGIIIFCLIFPIGEEILFRGIIQSIASQLMIGNPTYIIPMPLLKGLTVQVLISAVCFGVTHFQYFNFKFDLSTTKKVLFAFIFGLFAGNLVEITGTILYAIIFHIIANIMATIYYIIKTNKNSNLAI